SNYYYRVFYEYSYNTSDYFSSADKAEILSFIIVFSSINSLHLIFKSVINSSVTQSLTFSNIVLFFTVSLLINIFL
ncbi:hypothetical protein EMPG_12546, partial [Blastomyces silverae]